MCRMSSRDVRFGSKVDIAEFVCNVRLVPIADIQHEASMGAEPVADAYLGQNLRRVSLASIAAYLHIREAPLCSLSMQPFCSLHLSDKDFSFALFAEGASRHAHSVSCSPNAFRQLLDNANYAVSSSAILASASLLTQKFGLDGRSHARLCGSPHPLNNGVT